MYSYSENNTFEIILNRLLSNVPDSFDKREGSIIYDALAPAAAELAQCYIALDVYGTQTYVKTAVGENLDNRVADYGIHRIPATYAQASIRVLDTSGNLMTVPIGSRFAVPNESGGYNFEIIEQVSTGMHIGQCETLGSGGNTYTGDLLPLQGINNLGVATILAISKDGEDEETDDELRARTLRRINQESFAGNKAAYREMMIAIDGVADCKVYPAWNGGGTVKLAVIGPNHSIPSDTFIDDIQDEVDPLVNSGEGLGKAPIGHQVTVVAPSESSLDITATLTLSGTTLANVQSAVEEELGKYFYEVQSDFVDKDKLIIYVSKVSAAILNVPGIENVTDVTIDATAADYEIDNSAGTTIEYPTLGTVTLS